MRGPVEGIAVRPQLLHQLHEESKVKKVKLHIDVKKAMKKDVLKS